jgi:hypothetical protein
LQGRTKELGSTVSLAFLMREVVCVHWSYAFLHLRGIKESNFIVRREKY